jgi:hypothetical protein
MAQHQGPDSAGWRLCADMPPLGGGIHPGRKRLDIGEVWYPVAAVMIGGGGGAPALAGKLPKLTAWNSVNCVTSFKWWNPEASPRPPRR